MNAPLNMQQKSNPASTTFQQLFLRLYSVSLDDTNSVRNIKSIEILAQSYVALLQASWSDESIDLLALNIVQLLDGRLDLTLVGLDVNNENKSVGILNELHGRFRRQWILDN